MHELPPRFLIPVLGFSMATNHFTLATWLKKARCIPTLREARSYSCSQWWMWLAIALPCMPFHDIQSLDVLPSAIKHRPLIHRAIDSIKEMVYYNTAIHCVIQVTYPVGANK